MNIIIYINYICMNNLNTYLLESMIKKSVDVSLNTIELLALYTMIDVTDCEETLKETKHKIEMVLRSHITKLLRDYNDISKYYDYKTIFEPKTKEDANNLLDIIISEIKRNK